MAFTTFDTAFHQMMEKISDHYPNYLFFSFTKLDFKYNIPNILLSVNLWNAYNQKKKISLFLRGIIECVHISFKLLANQIK